MPYEKANAITIRYADWSETSRVFTFYTREFGRLAALAKGAKRKHSRIVGHVDLLSYGQIVFASGHSRGALHILSEACLFERFASLRRDLARFYAACHAAALVNAMTAEEDPNADLFDALLALLRRLDDGLSPPLALFAFEARLLLLTGFMPELVRCVSCGRQGRAKEAAFSALRGGILCSRCSAEDASPVERFPSGALTLVATLARGRLTRLDRISIAPAAAEHVRTFLTSYETHVIGRPLPTATHL